MLSLRAFVTQFVDLALAELFFRDVELGGLLGADRLLEVACILGHHVGPFLAGFDVGREELFHLFLVLAFLDAGAQGLLGLAECDVTRLDLVLGLVVDRPETLGLFGREFQFGGKEGDLLALQELLLLFGIDVPTVLALGGGLGCCGQAESEGGEKDS